MSPPMMGREEELVWLGVKGGECHGFAVFSPGLSDMAEISVCGIATRQPFGREYGVGYGLTRCEKCAVIVKVRGYKERA
jgi:hypothetical protein